MVSAATWMPRPEHATPTNWPGGLPLAVGKIETTPIEGKALLESAEQAPLLFELAFYAE